MFLLSNVLSVFRGASPDRKYVTELYYCNSKTTSRTECVCCSSTSTLLLWHFLISDKPSHSAPSGLFILKEPFFQVKNTCCQTDSIKPLRLFQPNPLLFGENKGACRQTTRGSPCLGERRPRQRGTTDPNDTTSSLGRRPGNTNHLKCIITTFPWQFFAKLKQYLKNFDNIKVFSIQQCDAQKL